MNGTLPLLLGALAGLGAMGDTGVEQDPFLSEATAVPFLVLDEADRVLVRGHAVLDTDGILHVSELQVEIDAIDCSQANLDVMEACVFDAIGRLGTQLQGRLLWEEARPAATQGDEEPPCFVCQDTSEDAHWEPTPGPEPLQRSAAPEFGYRPVKPYQGIHSQADAVEAPQDETAFIGALAFMAAPAIVGGLALTSPGQALLGARRLIPWTRLLGGVLLFSRIGEDELLENQTRAKVHDYLLEHPGASIQRVRDHVGIAWGTAVYHLGRLEKMGKVTSLRDGNYRRYWHADDQELHRRRDITAVRPPTARALASAVVQHPGCAQKELCQELGIRNPTASKYLKRLEERALVRSETRSRFRIYFPTDNMQRLMATEAWQRMRDKDTAARAIPSDDEVAQAA